MNTHEQHERKASHPSTHPRSGHWPTVQHHFVKDNPLCAVCKRGHDEVKLNVHHQIPFSYCIELSRPELELEPENLVTLCVSGENHHLYIGHLDDFHSYNPDVQHDIKHYANKSKLKILNDRQWRLKKQHRPQPAHKMSDQEKEQLREYLNVRFPPSGVHQYTRNKKRQRNSQHYDHPHSVKKHKNLD